MDSSDGEFVCKTEFEISDVVLGFLLTIGIIISFLPQIFVILFRKNVDGLSVIMCWLNYVNCMGTFMNVLFLNWYILECCSWMNSWNCFRNLLPVTQLASPFFCALVVFILYVIYRPKPTTNLGDSENKGEISKIIPDSPQIKYSESVIGSVDSNNNNNNSQIGSINNGSLQENMSISLNTDETNHNNANNNNNNNTGIYENSSSPSSASSSGELSPRSEQPLLPLYKPNTKVEEFIIKMDFFSQPFFWGSILLTLVIFGAGIGIVYTIGSKSDALQHYAFACGIFALILVFVQWIPQIYTTIIKNEIGSLSLVTVCIQAPGSFLVMFFQIQSKQNWSTWVPYLASAIQMIILICICVYYLIRDRKKNKKLKEEKSKAESNDINNSDRISGNNDNSNGNGTIDNQIVPENYQSQISRD